MKVSCRILSRNPWWLQGLISVIDRPFANHMVHLQQDSPQFALRCSPMTRFEVMLSIRISSSATQPTIPMQIIKIETKCQSVECRAAKLELLQAVTRAVTLSMQHAREDRWRSNHRGLKRRPWCCWIRSVQLIRWKMPLSSHARSWSSSALKRRWTRSR